MGLKVIDLMEVIVDSPHYHETLHAYELELRQNSQATKQLIQSMKGILDAHRDLSKAQRSFSTTLTNFEFECIGTEQTEDEVIIANSLKQFGKLISCIEDQRDILLDKAYEQFIHPLECFRKEQIGGAKDGKKKFEKQTNKFYQSMERYLNQKASKGTDAQLKEADATLQMERRHFCQASMEYVLLLQEVQERKKFEFVEPLLGFMLQWLTFYHQGHDVHNDFKPYMLDLTHKIQKTRENFNTMQDEAKHLMKKTLEKPAEQPCQNKTFTRQGYLFLQEKSKLPKGLGTTWTKLFCKYRKESKQLSILPYNQTQGKGLPVEEWVTLTSCTRRAADSIDKRFCFDITVEDRPGVVMTLQALSEEDRRAWLDAMDGKEPVYSVPTNTNEATTSLDETGFLFVKKCIKAVESRGLEDQGLYRVVGVASKVTKLTNMGLDRRKVDKMNLDDSGEWEVKTITSALKNYFRSLPEPVMTFDLHTELIAAAKQDKSQRIRAIHFVIHKLPSTNQDMLKLLVEHLRKIADNSQTNLMPVANIGVCFGPTLMRPKEETMAAIMDIKFCNIVVEVLIENYEQIFFTDPDTAPKPPVAIQKPSRPDSCIPPPPKENNSDTDKTPTGTPMSQHKRTPSGGELLNSSTQSSPTVGLAGAGAKGVTTPPSDNGPTYTNVTYAQVRAKLRPTSGLYNQYAAGEQPSSNSSSTESLNSRSSTQSSPPIGAKSQTPDSRRSTQHIYANLPRSGNRINQGPPETGKVRTLYACTAENESELSFEPNQIIQNVRPSREPGWLEGTLGGRTGLIPANYVEYLN